MCTRAVCKGHSGQGRRLFDRFAKTANPGFGEPGLLKTRCKKPVIEESWRCFVAIWKRAGLSPAPTNDKANRGQDQDNGGARTDEIRLVQELYAGGGMNFGPAVFGVDDPGAGYADAIAGMRDDQM